jgi:hypothetical protein
MTGGLDGGRKFAIETMDMMVTVKITLKDNHYDIKEGH